MNGNAIVAYSLLATLNNTGGDLVTSVYLPMFKRVLGIYCQDATSGYATDIQARFESEYGFSIPEYTTRQFLRLVEKELHGRDKLKFNTFSKAKSFTSDGYSFIELEERRDLSCRKISALESAFFEFAKSKGMSIDSSLTISLFLSENRQYLSSLFVTRAAKSIRTKINVSDEKLVYIDFIKEIENNNPALYEVCRELYLGSIIASLLEAGVDFSTKTIVRHSYYFDTQFILRALDLQDTDETKPAVELLALLKGNGSELRVLNISIDEIQSILDGVIKSFDQNAWLSATRNASVQFACHRRGLTKTDLQRICDNIGKIIIEELGLNVEEVSLRLIKACDGSPEHTKLMERRFTKASALHDICAIYHIRNRRGSTARSAQKAKIWFVSPNSDLIRFNIENIDPSAIKEVVSPDELACLVWLQSPTLLGQEASRIGLNSLIAETISCALPSIQVLNDMPKNLAKYADITEDEYAGAITRASQMSLSEINKIHDELSRPESAQFALLRMAEEQKEILKMAISGKGDALESVEQTRQKFELIIEQEKANRIQIESDLRLLILNEQNEAERQRKILISNNQELQSRENRNRIFIYSLIIILVIFVIWFVVQSVAIKAYIKVILSTVVGFGGLWTFGNLLINIIKFKK